MHFAEPGRDNWRTQADWDADRSLAGRLKRRYALNCFGRTGAEMTNLAAGHGFTDIAVVALHGKLTVPGDDDVTSQHLLTARRALSGES